MQEFAGRTAVVTGAASGIGLALADRFARAGMNVVAADIEKPALDVAVEQLAAHGTEVEPVACDVSVYEQVVALEERTRERFGGTHVLCNNAGVGGGGFIADSDQETWEWTLGVNLWGVINGCRAFLRGMLDAGEPGHVVNTASIAGHLATPAMGAYNVSKYGVVALSETLLQEMRLTGSSIGVSVLCPGFVKTRIHEADRNRPDELIPEGASPEDALGFRNLLGSIIEGATDPSVVADEVFAAIETERFWVLPHPEFLPRIEQRAQSILDGTDPPWSGLS